VIRVGDLAGAVAASKAIGARFRNEAGQGPGGTQGSVGDPSGNPIELFEARGDQVQARCKRRNASSSVSFFFAKQNRTTRFSNGRR